MRSEQEMLDLILKTAQDDNHIRAVIMNGSRANPNAPRDIFQDFDIVYIVTDIAPYIRNLEWIKRFGEPMIIQLPDDMGEPPPIRAEGYTYLMQFTDGNRIDLGVYPFSSLDSLLQDSQTIILLDKDGIIPLLPPAGDAGYLPLPPTAKQFYDCCNEFWWVCPYVAKGLWREQILYAHYMLEEVIRTELMKMLVWYIGCQTDFKINPGKYGKYYNQYLTPELWQSLLSTYSDSDYAQTWEALFAMGELFRNIATQVSVHMGFLYPAEEDARVSAHLRHVRNLSRDASEIY